MEFLRTVTGRICIVLFLDVLAFAIVIPVLPSLILSLTDGDAGQAAFLQGSAATLDGALKFIMQPFLGRLSDSVGRKYILMYSLVGSSVAFSLYVVFPSVPTLFVAHALHGASQCTFLVCMSMISDDAHNPDDPSVLTHAFGMVGVAVGIAFVLGPILGGALSQTVGYAPVYAISSVLFAVSCIALWKLVDETLPVELRRSFSWKEALPLKSAYEFFSQSKALLILSLAYFLCSLTVGVYGVWILMTTVKYGWHELMAGVLLSLNGILVVIAQGCVLRATVPTYVSETTTSLISYAAHAVLFIFVGAAPTGNSMLAAVVIFGVPSALGEPAFKSVLSHAVPKEKQGELQGLMGSVYTLASLGAILYSELFRFGISEEMRNLNPLPCPEIIENGTASDDPARVCGGYPGLPFIVQGIIFFLATILMRHGFRMLANEGHLDSKNGINVESELTDLEPLTRNVV